MTIYNIGVKGGSFFNADDSSPLKSTYNSFDQINFINYDEISPILNIFKTDSNKTEFKLDVSTGYITNKDHPIFSDYTKTIFNYTLVYTGKYKVFIVKPTFYSNGYNYEVLP